MVIKNYSNKAEMERAQKEFLRQAMEMAGRAVKEVIEEKIAEPPEEKPKLAEAAAEKPATEKAADTQTNATAETHTAEILVTEQTTKPAAEIIAEIQADKPNAVIITTVQTEKSEIPEPSAKTDTEPTEDNNVKGAAVSKEEIEEVREELFSEEPFIDETTESEALIGSEPSAEEFSSDEVFAATDEINETDSEQNTEAVEKVTEKADKVTRNTAEEVTLPEAEEATLPKTEEAPSPEAGETPSSEAKEVTSECDVDKEENTTFFPDTCPVVFVDNTDGEDDNIKAAYEILGEISESSRILGKIIAEESTGESASELPPPTFAGKIDKHNSKL